MATRHTIIERVVPQRSSANPRLQSHPGHYVTQQKTCTPHSDVMTPIRYDGRQVALMVKFSIHISQDFPRRVRETPEDLCLMAMGLVPPSAAVLEHFDLTSHGDSYWWQAK